MFHIFFGIDEKGIESSHDDSGFVNLSSHEWIELVATIRIKFVAFCVRHHEKNIFMINMVI